MCKILIVDDSAILRDAMARLLALEGYTVSTAINGRYAWITLYADLPDLIVLDLMMPEMGGITFLRMLRSHHHWNKLPVLVITGLDQDESLVQEARAFGVVDIIRKGRISIDLLLEQVAALFPRSDEAPIPLRHPITAPAQL
jgi:DNA-binding response OmpR family regulator